MKTNLSVSLVKVAVMVLVAGCFGATLASAQEVTGKFNLPFETHWGKAVLAPGDYSFRVNFMGGPPDYTVLTREDDQRQTIVMASTRTQATFSKSGLMVERHGNRGTVSSLRLAEASLVIYYPMAKAQPPMLAKGPVLIQRIPILVAQK